MTKDALKKVLLYRATAAGLPSDGLNEYIDAIIEASIEQFWGEYPWTFRTRPHTLAITTAAERYELPADCEGIRHVRDQEDPRGQGLVNRHFDLFQDQFPKPLAHPLGPPKFWAMGWDAALDKWFIHFFPVPPPQSIPMSIVTTAPAALEKIPNGFVQGVEDLATLKLYKVGSNMESFAKEDYEKTLKKLIHKDSPYKGALPVMAIATRPGRHGGRFPWRP